MKTTDIHLQVSSASGDPIGFFDGEFVVSNEGETLYRVDGEEIYTPGNNTRFLGYLEDRTARSVTGETLFTLSE